MKSFQLKQSTAKTLSPQLPAQNINEIQFKPGEWENYKFLASRFKLGIGEIKRIFRRHELLDKNILSDYARENGYGVDDKTEKGRFGSFKRILWSVARVADLLEKAGHREDQDKKVFRCESYVEIVGRVMILNQRLLGVLRFDQTNRTPRWIVEKFGADVAAHYIFNIRKVLLDDEFAAKYLAAENKRAFERLFRRNFDSAFLLLEYVPNTAANEAESEFLVNLRKFILEWVTDERLSA